MHCVLEAVGQVSADDILMHFEVVNLVQTVSHPIQQQSCYKCDGRKFGAALEG